jgi:hypothetical protein
MQRFMHKNKISSERRDSFDRCVQLKEFSKDYKLIIQLIARIFLNDDKKLTVDEVSFYNI